MTSDARRHRPTTLAGPGVPIDERLVRVETGGQGRSPALRELGVAPDDDDVRRVAIAGPHGKRRAPVAITRERPVDVVGQPLAEPPRADLRRVPVHRAVQREHPVAERRRPDEPGVAGVVDELAAAAPAMRIGVDVLFRQQVPAVGLEAADDEFVGFVGGDQQPLEFRPAGADEGPVGRHRPEEREPVRLPGRVVVGAERRRHVHDAGAVRGRDEVAGHHDAVHRVVRKRHHVERPAIPEASEGAAEHHPLRRLHRALSEEPGEELGRQARRQHQPPAWRPRVGVLAVLEIRVHRRRHVRGEGPRRRGPNDEFPARPVLEREGHEDRLVSDLLVPLRELVTGQHRAAARTVRQHPVAPVEQAAVVQPAEDPPDRLDVLVAERDVRMGVVEPVPDPVGERFPVRLVGEYTAAAERVEPLDAVFLDGLLPLQLELLLHLDFHRQPVGVPPGDSRDGAPLHGAEAADEVLDGARKDVVDPRPAVGRRRPLEEHEGRTTPARLHALAEEVFGFPGLEQLLLELVGAEVGKRRKGHQGRRRGETLTPAS